MKTPNEFNQADIESLGRKMRKANPHLGWHSAWIMSVRLFSTKF